MKRLREYKTVVEEEKLLLTRCRTAIESIDPSAEVILYGSRARGDGTEESDYDLLILIDGDVTLEREDIICRQLYPIELETGKVISAIVYNHQQWNTPLYRVMPFHRNIDRDGVII